MSNLPDGLCYHADFITASEEQNLIHHIQLLDWQEVFLFGQVAKRRVVHFGMDYHYEHRRIKPTQPAPEFLKKIIGRGSKLLMVGFEDIAEVLISEYPINAGIGWHRDAPVFESVLGISLGSPTWIHFRKRTDHTEKCKLILQPSSAYTLKGSVRWNWEHRIPPVKQLRYSITFRTLRAPIP